ncbi:Arc family DNA-binding protein [Xenorhabdus bovienii]|uniref:Arc family DNA-binding protein n=1 Tax=Xenorhabdus bovienii TaxID=40576 RepID=UPI003F682EDE
MQDKFNLRFPDGMRDAIAERAKKNGRSMNSELIEMLKFAMNIRPTWVEEDEIYLSDNTGFGGGFDTQISVAKYPDKDNGMLLKGIKKKIDELNDLIDEIQEENSTNKKAK